MTDTVYQYTKAREKSRVFSSKGSSVSNKDLIGPPSQNNRYRAFLFVVGVDAGKRLLFNRLKVNDFGPAYVHYPMARDSGFTEEYFKQLTAEVFERKFEKGRVKEGWKKLRERNEALDCAVYATAAIEIVRPAFNQLCAQGANTAVIQSKPVKTRKYSKGVI